VSGSYQVMAIPGLAGLHVLPSDPGQRFGHRTRLRGQLRAEPSRDPAAERAKPHPTGLRITEDTPEGQSATSLPPF
jgi:hypothetical protein